MGEALWLHCLAVCVPLRLGRSDPFALDNEVLLNAVDMIEGVTSHYFTVGAVLRSRAAGKGWSNGRMQN